MKSILKRLVVATITAEAQAVLKKYHPRIVAITGSVGKTSTKDAIYAVLSRSLSVRKSKKNLNTDFGVPLTILGCGAPIKVFSIFQWLDIIFEGLKLILLPSHYPEWLVLEIGADHPGDIESITRWVKPDVSVVTKLAKIPVHVEFFASPQEVYREKGFLVRALKPGGTLVLNADDEDVLAYADESPVELVLFGLSPEADVRGEHYRISYSEQGRPTGFAFDVLTAGERYKIEWSGTIGAAHQYHALAALAVARTLGLDLARSAQAFGNYEPTPGRMRLLEGKKGTVIVDDTYNSSPVAVSDALSSLADIRAERRIAVLGDMLELGRYSAEAHREAGREAARTVDVLLAVGIRMRYAAEAAVEAGLPPERVHTFEDARQAGAFLKDFIQPGDLLLFKGSQGVRMERAVEGILAQPKDKDHLLVRHDKEWKVRDRKV